MCLADLFLHSSRRSGFGVAHCNFHLRGADSDADETFVRAWAEGAGVPFHRVDFDTAGYAVSKGISVEMAAREFRYAWFGRLCQLHEYGCVAVAHNLNDKGETMILNLLRGTGLRGISGMPEISSLPEGSRIPLIRPLLGFSRAELEAYAVSRGLAWREDRTNADSVYKRNCVRNEVFPLFQALNPSFLATLDRNMQHLRQVQEIADDYYDSVKDTVAVPGTDGPEMEIRIPTLRSLRHADYVLYRLLAPFGFTTSDIDNIRNLLRNGVTRSGKTFPSKEYSLVTTSELLRVVRTLPASRNTKASDDLLKISGPGSYSLAGRSFCVSVEKFQHGMSLKQPSGTIIFDGRSLPFPFSVRLWREGDWMRPLGVRTVSGKPGRKKLSDLFVDLKIARAEKKEALVIADEGSHVKVLLGHRIDESVMVTDASQTVTRIRFI